MSTTTNEAASSRITRKGQVTIPASIRKRLGLKRGQRVAFVDQGGQVIMKPIVNDVTALFGIVKAKRTVSLQEMQRAIRERGGR